MSAASYGRRRSHKKPIFKKKVFWYAVLAVVLMVFVATALQLLDNRSVEAASQSVADATAQSALEAAEKTAAEAEARKNLTTKQQAETISKAMSLLIPGGVDATPARKASFDQIIEFFQKGEFKNVEEQLQKMQAADSELPPADFLMAGLAFAINNKSKGVALLERTAVQHPDYPGVYLFFAQLALNNNRITDAVSHVDKSRSLLSGQKLSAAQESFFSTKYLEILTAIFVRRGQSDQALESLSQLQALEADRPFYLLARAGISYRADDQDKAFEFLKKHALTLEPPGNPEVTLIGWYRRDRKTAEAEAFLEKSLKLQPQVPQLQMLAADMYLQQEKFNESMLALSQYESLGGENKSALEHLKAQIAFAGQSYDVAETHYENLAKSNPKNLSFLNSYALCLIESENPEKRALAKSISQKVASQMRNSRLALATYGYTLLKNGDGKQSSQLFSQLASTTSQDSPDVAYMMAHWQNELGQKEIASKILEQAVQVNSLFLYRSAAKSLLEKIKSKAVLGIEDVDDTSGSN